MPHIHGNGISIVVGQEELDNRSVNVRNRDDVGTKAKTAMIPLDSIIEKLVKLKANKSLQNTLPE
jgi:threonyl-tRNA synthetase